MINNPYHSPKRRGRPVSKNGVLYIRGIPDSVKNLFKAHCLRRGVSMTNKIIELMKEEVRPTVKLEEEFPCQDIDRVGLPKQGESYGD